MSPVPLSVVDIAPDETTRVDERPPCYIHPDCRPLACHREVSDDHAAEMRVLWTCGCVDAYCQVAVEQLMKDEREAGGSICDEPVHLGRTIHIAAIEPIL